MRKSDLKILEKIFSEEICGNIYQSKSKRLDWLDENGYVERAEFTIPGRFPVHVRGWALTHKGRMEYCASCKDFPDE